jgi:hypothetical protein
MHEYFETHTEHIHMHIKGNVNVLPDDKQVACCFFVCYLDGLVSIVFQGAMIGGVACLSFMSWVCLGTQAALAAGDITFETKPVSVEGCTYDFMTPSSASVNATMKPHKE